MRRTASDHVLKCYMPFLNSTSHELLFVGSRMPIPKFDAEIIEEIVDSATETLKNEGPLLDLEPPFCVVGDIHGNLRDLLRIIAKYFLKSDYKFLFLGDYVDRGQFSLEVVTLLYALRIKFPKRFFLIRGNHEVLDSSKPQSIADDCVFTYGNASLVDLVYNSFSWLPIAAIIGKKILCLHGGLSPMLQTLQDIRAIELPFSQLNNELISDILWSDPNKLVAHFMESSRGRGKLFGQNTALKFLKANDLELLIRGHQCVLKGVEYFSDNVITVFSSSYYNDEEENKAGCVIISEELKVTPIKFTAIQQIKRQSATFVDSPAYCSNGIPQIPKQVNRISSFGPLPTLIPPTIAKPKKRRMSGVVALKPMCSSACVKKDIKFSLPRLPTHL